MLELGVPPEDIQMEEVGEQVMWGPDDRAGTRRPALGTLNGGALNEESGATLVQEDGAIADDDAMA